MALSVVVLILPSPYVVEMPGPTQDVLGTVDSGTVIDVEGVDTYEDSGELLLVTVSALGVSGYPITNAQALWGWLNPQTSVLPREAVVPVGMTDEEYTEQNAESMSSSQDAAVAAAKTYIAAHADELGVSPDVLDEATVTMHVDDIGGPSAGMMYTLGLISKLTAVDEAGGQIIAGTGTIDENGEVGSIGGIRLKMQGAKRDGATWFLAPEANCDSVVGHVPDGLRDVKVSTLEEAYAALVAIGNGEGDDLPHCTA
ncbi:lon protease [Bifidobacterium eulemuris]|uniref:Lon protease n=1 Tax=Bifidobacterium eulemuris TaxID=1765219 RepID=A0A261G7C3_9BIFI|nr:lon protease [Bifidobacterium eulemuris]